MRAHALGVAAVAWAVIVGAVGAAAPASAQLIYTQIPEPGDTFANACEQTPLHAAPNGYAEVVGTAAFKQTFKVVAVTEKYLLPKSMRYSTTHGSTEDAWDRQRGRVEHDPRDFFPAWVEVETDDGTAFVTMRCMVTPEFAEQQTIEDAERKFEQAAIAEGGKGFQLKPASGGSGKGLSGQLAALGEDRDAVAALLARGNVNPQVSYKDFRRAGGLGEFAPAINDPDLRAKPARDVKRAPEGGAAGAGAAVNDAFNSLFGN
jgi:hypothetical protein